MYNQVIEFWFEETHSELWFKKDADFDRKILSRFVEVHQQARRGELWLWREDALGRLAEIIVLDQFSRNIYRDTASAFAYDDLSLILAEEAISANADQSLTASQKAFLYMPFMHSESLAVHQWAVQLYKAPGLEFNYEFELKHKAIIERFGRYPHRNAILGRESTAEELAFLQTEGSSF